MTETPAGGGEPSAEDLSTRLPRVVRTPDGDFVSLVRPLSGNAAPEKWSLYPEIVAYEKYVAFMSSVYKLAERLMNDDVQLGTPQEREREFRSAAAELMEKFREAIEAIVDYSSDMQKINIAKAAEYVEDVAQDLESFRCK